MVSLTQNLRDEIIADIQALNIPNVQSEYVKKAGVLPQTKCCIMVDCDDEVELGDIGGQLRMVVATIFVCVFIPQDRNGDFLDEVTSQVEEYVHQPRLYGPYTDYTQARAQQIMGSSKRIDTYGQDAWFVRTYEFVVPFARNNASPSASASGSA